VGYSRLYRHRLVNLDVASTQDSYVSRRLLSRALPEDQLAAFKTYVQQAENDIKSAPSKVPEVDWEYYSSKISRKEVVQNIKNAFQAAQEADKAKLSEDPSKKFFDSEFQVKLAEAEAAKAKSIEDIKALEAELASLEEERGLVGNMTLEEYLERNPDVKELLIQDLENDRWDPEIIGDHPSYHLDDHHGHH